VIVLVALLVFVLVMRPRRGGLLASRLTVVGGVAAIVTAYFWLPFLREQQYLEISPYLQEWKYNSFGAQAILYRLLSGQLYDSQRLPVFTLLLVFGLAGAITRPTRQRRLAIVLFAVWMILYFGRATLGEIANLLPMHQGLLFHRFVGPVDFAAILLVGLGGEWLWERFVTIEEPWRTALPFALIVVLMVPALVERYEYYRNDARWLKFASESIDSDEALRDILDKLKTLPAGRTYAGQRSDWGKNFKVGGVPMWDILTSKGFDMVEPPFQGLSLNSDLEFHFKYDNAAMYDLFNVRYVVAPSAEDMPTFLTPILKTSRYTLYEAHTSGYGELANEMLSAVAGSQRALFDGNLRWLQSDAVSKRQFYRWSYRIGAGPVGGVFYPPYRGGGRVFDEQVGQGLIRLRVDSPSPALVVIKTTYHPNWHVTIDRKPAEVFMASPSFIGVRVPAGDHQVVAEYRSGVLKKSLLAVGILVLIISVVLRRRFVWLDARLSRWTAGAEGTSPESAHEAS
jgi:hypothetical protein